MTDQYRALLIGNAVYPEDPLGLPTLNGPINDIAMLRAALEDPDRGVCGFGSVTLLPDRTSAEVLTAVTEFLDAATAEETLLVYYSGHVRPDTTGDLHLCTRDTACDWLPMTAASVRRIHELADAAPARDVVTIVDGCGGLDPDSGDLLTGNRERDGRHVLACVRELAQANDNCQPNHPDLFTGRLIAALRGAMSSGRGGQLSLRDLYRLLRAQPDGPAVRLVTGSGAGPIVRRDAHQPPEAALPAIAAAGNAQAAASSNRLPVVVDGAGRHHRLEPAGTEEWLVDTIQASAFRPVRTLPFGGRRRGYAMREVDQFLDRIVASLRAGHLMNPWELRAVSFPHPPMLREGYAVAEVDAFLHQVVEHMWRSSDQES